MITFHRDEDITFAEYHEFLKRTDLGGQYPAERFEERVTMTLRNRSIGISARDGDHRLVGVCLGLTDFAYFLFITDLGVDRAYERQGLGTELMTRLHEAAGGLDEISAVTVSNKRAVGFYRRLGYEGDEALVWKPCRTWTPMKVE